MATSNKTTALPRRTVASNTAPAPDPLQRFDMLKKILPAWERTNKVIAKSSKQLQHMDRRFQQLTDTISELPVSEQRSSLADQLLELQDLLDAQLDQRKDEAQTSVICLEAFRKKSVVPPGSSGKVFLELFLQVLNDVAEDVSVRELLDGFTTNVVAVQTFKNAQKLDNTARVYAQSEDKEMKESKPPSPSKPNLLVSRKKPIASSRSTNNLPQAIRSEFNKDKTTTVIDTHALRESTNLKPMPKTQSTLGFEKRDIARAPGIWNTKPNKIRFIKAKSLATTKAVKTPTKPRLSEEELVNRHKNLIENDHIDNAVKIVKTAAADLSNVADETKATSVLVAIAPTEDIAYKQSRSSVDATDVASNPVLQEAKETVNEAAMVETVKHDNDSSEQFVIAGDRHRNPRQPGTLGIASTTPKEPKSNKTKRVSERTKESKAITTSVGGVEEEIVSNGKVRPIHSSMAPRGGRKDYFDQHMEGIDLANIVSGSRRKNTGIGSTPPEHIRKLHSACGGNKRKHIEEDKEEVPIKRAALEGHYIARRKTCRWAPGT